MERGIIKSKKIICTVTNDLNYDQRMIRICTSLSNAGYEVLLVGRKRSDSKPLSKKVFQQTRLNCFFEKGKWFYIEYNLRLFFFLLFQPFDIICSVDLDTILPGVLIGKLKRKFIVYDAHEYFTEVPEVVNRPTIKAVWERIAQWSIPKVNLAYTVCESLAEIFPNLYGQAFAVIRNVPFKKTVPETLQKETPTVILYQGVLNDGRGLEAAITAMQYIENAQLWLAGEGDLSQELRALSQKLKLQDKVHFLGYILPEELSQITLKASIGLNLLENKGLNYYYSLANKAFDYIQAKLPSIHMQFPEYEKLNAQFHTFHLIPDLDAKTVELAFQKLLSDPKFYQQLVDNCSKAREILTWEEEEKKLIQLYNKIP